MQRVLRQEHAEGEMLLQEKGKNTSLLKHQERPSVTISLELGVMLNLQ